MELLSVIRHLLSEKALGQYGLSRVNQQQHALQAATLAERNGEPPALIAAALLHDIGHMIHDLGEDPASAGIDDMHEARGADWLSAHFPPAVAEPVRLHVQAKRYLCAVDVTYFSKLSDDSVRSLELQGGPMSESEVIDFANLPYAAAAIRLRRLDEAAKDPAAATPHLEHFMPMVVLALADRS